MSTAAIPEAGELSEAAIGRRVRIAYTDACGETSVRAIEPLCISRGRNGCTYLRAYCHLREEERTFRLDRIRSWEEIGRNPARSAPLPSSPRPTDRRGPTPAAPPTDPPRAAAVVPAAPALASGPQPARRRRPFRALLVLGLLFFAGRWLVINAAPGQTPVPPSRMAPAPERMAPTSPESGPRPVLHLSYRGIEITATPSGSGYLFAAPAHSLSAGSLRALHLQINSRLFRRATGIADPALEELYAGADTNRDGYLCWREITEFQRGLTARFEYRRNATALRPDEFLARGGGDCEDWALATCGLLRYWGWEAYVGAFFPPKGGDGHAVCLVRWKEHPRGFEYYRVEEGTTAWDGAPVRPGYYVPIDYQVVGGSSNALKRGWVLRHFYTPERIYGAAM